MAEAAGLYVTLSTNSAAFNKAMDAAEEKFAEVTKAATFLGQKMQKTGLAFTAAGAAITGAFGLMFNSFTKTADSMEDMSFRTGIAVESLRELGYVAKLTDTSLEEIQVSIKRLQTSITEAADGNVEYAQSLQRIGLTVNDLERLTPEEQFNRVSAAIAEIENPTERAARAVEFFGRSGTSLLPMLAEGADGIAKLRQEAHDVGYVFSAETAHSASIFRDTIDKVQMSLSATGAIISEQFLPFMQKLADIVLKVTVAIKNWAQEYPKLTKAITAAVIAIGAISLAMGALLIVVGKIVAIAPAVATAWGLIGGPPVWIAAAVAALVAAFVTLLSVWDDLGDTVKGLLIVFAPLISIPIVLIKNWDTFLYGLAQAFGVVKIAALSMIAAVLESLIGMLGRVPKIGAALKASLSSINKQIAQESIDSEKRTLDYKQHMIDKELQAHQQKNRGIISDTKETVKVEEGYYKALLDYQIAAGQKTLQDKIAFLNKELETVRAGTLQEIQIRQELLSVEKQINDEKARNLDAMYSYERSQLDTFSKEQQSAWRANQKAILEARLQTAVQGSAEYYDILSRLDEENRAMQELSNYDMQSGFKNALDQMATDSINFKDVTLNVFDSLHSAISSTFVAVIDNLGKGWEGFKDSVVAIGNTLKNAIIGQLADIAAQWVIQRTAMLIKDKLFAKEEIAIAANVGAAKSAAGSAYLGFGSLAIAAAIFAAIMAFAGAFAKGGIVGGSSYHGDNMIARVNSGEMILTERQQANLWAMANGAGSTAGPSNTATITQNISFTAGTNIAAELADAMREGTTEALALAGLTYTVGGKQSGVAL